MHRVRKARGNSQRPGRSSGLPGRRRTPAACRGHAERGADDMTEHLLETAYLDVRYGTSQALFGVSITVAPGPVLAVLGVTGAGKSTLARAVSGLVAPCGGRVSFEGQDITGWPAHRI